MAFALAMGVAPGAWAQSLVLDDGQVHDISGRDITTAGQVGLEVSNGSIARGANVTISTTGDVALGVDASNTGNIDLENVEISTTGLGSHGVSAINPATTVGLRNAEITTTGEGATGVRALNEALVNLRESILHAMGVDAAAAQVAGGRLIAIESTLTSESASAALVEGLDSDLRTVDSQLRANGAMDVVRVDFQGAAHLSGGTVTAGGGSNHALHVTGGSSLLADAGIQIATQAGMGAVVSDGATLEFVSARVQTTGAPGTAVSLDGAGTAFFATESTIRAQLADGLVVANGAAADLVDTDVISGAHAIRMQSTTADTNTVSMAGGRLQSAASAIHVASGMNTLALSNGATVLSDSGTIIRVESAGRLDAAFDDADIVGDIDAFDAGIVNLALRNGASLRGAISNGAAIDVAAGTTWTLTRDSDVATLDNAGTVGFIAPGGASRTLTVRGDYVGSGGTLLLHTHLGGDDSGSDHLHVRGDTSGSTQLDIRNTAGGGAQTTNGIRVVQVDGASNGTFALAGRVVGGAFEYALFQGGVTEPDDGDWYLRSALSPGTGDPPDGDGGDGGNGGDGGAGGPGGPGGGAIYRPETGIYLANQAMATAMFRHRSSDRGALRNTTGTGPERHAWVRATRDHLDTTSGAGQLGIDGDARGIEIGSQFLGWTTGVGAFAVGAAFHDATAELEAVSRATRFRALGEVRGKAASLFGNWSADPANALGPRVDLWVQRGKFDHTVQGEGLARETYASEAFSTSLETGYAFQLRKAGGTALYFEPQLQFVLTDYDADVHVESNGTRIAATDASGLATRVGARLFGVVGRVQPYLELNAWHDDSGNALRFDDTTVDLELDNITWEGNAGLAVDFGKGWAAWGGLGVRHSSTTRDTHGQVGLRYRW